MQLKTLLPLFPTDSSDACFLLLFPHGSSWIATQLIRIVGFYWSSKLLMCIKEKMFGDSVFFSLHGRTNAMRSQGEVTETLNVSQNWLTSHSCNSGHVASPTQRENNNKAHALMCTFPGYKTTSVKKCPLTKNCSCCGYSQIISCCTGVVGMCGLHVRNIQVLFITGKISFVTRTPRNCRCWVSFHFTFK